MIDNFDNMPVVRTSEGFIEAWNREKIVNQIVKETKLCEKFYKTPAATREEAEEIAKKAEKVIKNMGLTNLSGPLVREVVNNIMLEEGHSDWRNAMTRVGACVNDALEIDFGSGFEANDNANQLNNAETSHKRKADKMSKEQNLLLLPGHISDAHLRGDLVIHDLEYFGTRPFCQDWDARYCFYYGLMPDGIGKQSSIAKPAKNAEVAILHLVKLMGSAQTNFSGGEGLYNFLTFLAPYFEGKSETEIKQCMQMFVYEMMQMMCARGGQSLGYDTLLVLKKDNNIMIRKIGDLCSSYLQGEGKLEIVDEGYEALSLNKLTGNIEWKPVTAVHTHIPKSDIVVTRLHDGKTVISTSDHSLFTLNSSLEFVETRPSETLDTIIAMRGSLDSENFSYNELDLDLAFLIGVCIGDGCIQNEWRMDLFLSNAEVRERVDCILSKLGKSTITWKPHNHRTNNKCYQGSFSITGIPYIKGIGRGAQNKHIPYELISMPNDILLSLMDGLLSTDGNVNRGRYEFCTTSEELIKQVEFIAIRLGLQCCVEKRENQESNFKRNFCVHRVRFTSRSSKQFTVTNSTRKIEPIDNIMDQSRNNFNILRDVIAKRLYKVKSEGTYSDLDCLNKTINSIINMRQRVKHEKIEKVKEYIPDIYNKVKNVYAMEVDSVTKIDYTGYVYDISVKDNENFILHNGIVAHNTVFSSVQLSPGVNKLWKNIPIVAFGKVFNGEKAPLRVYGDFERENRLGFKALMDVMLEGDAIGKPFSFPKPEISVEKDFMQEDEEFNKNNPDLPTYRDLYLRAFELAAKFGTPYFDNQLPDYRSSKGGISCYQCCAYQFSANPTSDLEFEDKMNFKDGMHFSMGSWQVMSLNCPRAAYKAEHDDKKLIAELKALMDKAIEVFKIKREWMNELIARNRIPFASQRPLDPVTRELGSVAVDFESLVYTIGVVGINEMVQYHTGSQIHESDKAYKLAIRIMFEMKLYAAELSKKHNMTIALARTPAETTAQRFAVSDLLHEEYREKAMQCVKGDIQKALNNINKTRDLPVYYTNGTHLPVNAKVSLPERIKYEQTFFPIVDGGNIMHIWMGEKSPNPEGLMDFAMNLCKNTQVGYFAFTRDMTVCIDEGYVASGILETCPKCGSKNVQHLSRITGYLQSVEGWNEGKKQELKDRKRYEIS